MARDEREQKALDVLNDKSIPTDVIGMTLSILTELSPRTIRRRSDYEEER